MTQERILVTGAAGFIGAHVLVTLADAGYECIPLDNFCNSKPDAIARARELARAGRIAKPVEADIRDRASIAALLSRVRVDAVIHLAGLKAVAESVGDPLSYYDNNVGGTIVLLEELAKSGVRRFVFSSSAAVYSPDGAPPFVEASTLGPVNPYGRTKLIIEDMLSDVAATDPGWAIACLRYFNPVGAHPSGRIGEDPRGRPSNLMPLVCDAVAGRVDALRILGCDYSTPDGTGVRDFIHVMDLAEGHVAALRVLESTRKGSCLKLNLGTGQGTSVIELVETFERVNGVAVPTVVVGRRPGDVAVSFADCSLAKSIMGWEATRSLDDMCRDAWTWRRRNPQGY